MVIGLGGMMGSDGVGWNVDVLHSLCQMLMIISSLDLCSFAGLGLMMGRLVWWSSRGNWGIS